jgi:predicted GTPase
MYINKITIIKEKSFNMKIFLKAFESKLKNVDIEPNALISSLRTTEIKDILKDSKLIFKSW